MIKEKIKALAHTIAPELIGIRHHLHANPELSYQEFEGRYGCTSYSRRK
jgi:hippurate hydrolase